MIARIRSFALIGLYWVFYMVVVRGIFLIYNYELSQQLTVSEIFQAMFRGLRMDLSISGYFLLLYGLFFTGSILAPGKRWVPVFSGFTYFLLFFCGVIVIVDMELYRHWGFRLNSTPFNYLGSGTFGSIGPALFLKAIAVLILLSLAFQSIYKNWIRPGLTCVERPVPRWKGLLMLLLTACLILPIRGSLSVAPMNAGFVYFHRSKPYANHSAINVVWNFMSSLKKTSTLKYPENFFDANDTELVMRELYRDTTPSASVLRLDKPNILLLVLESFTSNVIGALGGEPGITPYLDSLAREGVLFEHIYASGDRTDKGLVSILSGYPAQTQTSIVKFPGKTEKLPALTRELEQKGYHTSFLYGGDADFANFRSYLTNIGFEEVLEVKDFPKELNTSKWGVHDQYLFERLEKEMAKSKSPFFRTVLTLSSHEPFDVPMKEFTGGKTEEEMFLNSCRYTDYCLGQFFQHARKQSWWDSTLVIITADHGHRQPGNKALQDERRFRIPLLMLGGALAVQGQTISVTGSQTDIVNSLLGQLGGTNSNFRFSRDLLSRDAASFAAFFFQNGYGFVLPDKHVVYDHEAKDFVVKAGAVTEEDIRTSKAYQQAMFTDFNRK